MNPVFRVRALNLAQLSLFSSAHFCYWQQPGALTTFDVLRSRDFQPLYNLARNQAQPKEREKVAMVAFISDSNHVECSSVPGYRHSIRV